MTAGTAIPVHNFNVLDDLDFVHEPPCEFPPCRHDHPPAVALMVPPDRCDRCRQVWLPCYVCAECRARVGARGLRCHTCDRYIDPSWIKFRSVKA